jgi:hypothetical protein
MERLTLSAVDAAFCPLVGAGQAGAVRSIALQMISSSRTTALSDLAPLGHMRECEACFLTRTLVADLAPLTGLTRLERLDLGDTQTTDVLPLSGYPTCAASTFPTKAFATSHSSRH